MNQVSDIYSFFTNWLLINLSFISSADIPLLTSDSVPVEGLSEGWLGRGLGMGTQSKYSANNLIKEGEWDYLVMINNICFILVKIIWSKWGN